MKTHHLITTLTITALALVGCSSNDEPQSREEAQQQYADQLESGEYDPIDLEGESTPMENMGVMQAGEYETYSAEGAHITFELPTSVGNDELTGIEQYRQDVQADPVTYLVADVDNRQGTGPINMYQVKAFDEDGNTYEFSGVSEYIGDIAPSTDWDEDDGTYLLPDGTRLPQEEGSDLHSQSIDLHNEYLHGVDAAARDTMVLVYEGDDLPTEFTRVAVWPNGAFEEAEAYPVQ